MLNTEQIDYIKQQLVEYDADESWLNINFNTYEVRETLYEFFDVMEYNDFFEVYEIGNRYFQINKCNNGKKRNFASIKEVFKKERLVTEVYYE